MRIQVADQVTVLDLTQALASKGLTLRQNTETGDLYCDYANQVPRYRYERVPVGHDMGWSCIDTQTYDGGEFNQIGYGLSQNEAYVDLKERLS